MVGSAVGSRPGQGTALQAAPVSVILCCWRAGQPGPDVHRVPELVLACAQACLQGWAQRVTGSCCGMTPQGQGLLLVPVPTLAAQTAQALGALLNAASQAVLPGAGDWQLRIIGPLQPGLPEAVQRQLSQADWPFNRYPSADG